MSPRIILITGANRGIGFCIAQLLGLRDSNDTLLIASRSLASAAEAITKLKEIGVKCPLKELQLDVTNDDSIKAAVASVQKEYGRLDVLVNNAGIALIPSPDLSDFRQVYSSIFDTNVTSVGLVTSCFLPLLKQSEQPLVVNVSSGRASISRLTSGAMPPTLSVPYSVSKVALNVMTLEMAKVEQDVKFQVANPGHCKTEFNRYTGKKDPLVGAEVIAELVHGDYESGFWHNDNGKMEKMGW